MISSSDKMKLIATAQLLKEEFKQHGGDFTDLQIETFALVQILISNEAAYQAGIHAEISDELCYISTVKVIKDIMDKYLLEGDFKRFGAVYMYVGAMGLGGSF